MSVADELTEKELRRLSRRDLLALMVDMAKRTEELEKTLELERERHSRELEQVRAAYDEKTRQASLRAEKRLERLIDRLETGYSDAERTRGRTAGVFRNFFDSLCSVFTKTRKPN